MKCCTRLAGASDMSDVLLQCLRLISAVLDLLGHGIFMLTPESQNNAPSEIIPTWNLRNDFRPGICVAFVPKFYRARTE